VHGNKNWHGNKNLATKTGGHGSLAIDGEEHAFAVGDCWMLWQDARRVVTVSSQQPLTLLAIQYRPLGELRSPAPNPVTRCDDVALLVRLYERLRATLERDDGRASLEADCWYDGLLAATRVRIGSGDVRFDHDQTALIQDCCERIRCDPGAIWRVQELATACHLSRSQYTRIFTRVVGASPRQFLTRVRCDAAKHLLADTDSSIARIADDLGFSDAFHFSRQFKRSAGVSPSAWRAGGRSDG